MINGELIVDNFAGGGGASTGIEMATGYSVDIAINHDPEAIRMHKANHPNTKHYCEDVWQSVHRTCRSRQSRPGNFGLRRRIYGKETFNTGRDQRAVQADCPGKPYG